MHQSSLGQIAVAAITLVIAATGIIGLHRVGSRLDTVTDVAARSELESIILWTQVLVGVLCAGGIALCVFVAARNHRLSVGLLRQAVEFATHIERGDLAHREEIAGSAEAEALGRALTGLAETLEVGRARRQEADRRLELTIESCPAGMVLVDGGGRICMVNRYLEDAFGFSRAELLGQPIERLLPASARDRHVALREEYLRSPEARAMGSGRDLYGVKADGTEVPVEVGLNPLTIDGKPHVLAIVTDISPRKRAELAMQAANEALERSNAELAQFAYVASHDLQEPLRKVSSFCSLLREDFGNALDGTGLEYLQFAIDGADRMRALIQDLLRYSQIGTREFEPVPVDANASCDDAIQMLGMAIDESGAQVSHADLPTVDADPGRLTQLFQNLIGNAIKYHDGGPPRVTVTATRSGGEWQFTVEDDGIGIDPAQSERIFGIFERLHGRDRYSGTGIGLAIARRIVQRFGGRIWVEPNPSGGSRFKFTIPAAKVGRVPATSEPTVRSEPGE